MDEFDARRADGLGREEADEVFLGSVWRYQWLEISRFRDFEFHMTEAAERKERVWLDGVGTRKCWSEEWRKRTGWWMNVSRKILRRVLYRGLYMLWWPAWNEFCREQVAREVARDMARNGLICLTGEQFWQESFESVVVYQRAFKWY